MRDGVDAIGRVHYFLFVSGVYGSHCILQSLQPAVTAARMLSVLNLLKTLLYLLVH